MTGVFTDWGFFHSNVVYTKYSQLSGSPTLYHALADVTWLQGVTSVPTHR